MIISLCQVSIRVRGLIVEKHAGLTNIIDYFSRDREATSSNHVVHMTVKPADMEDDDTYKKKHKSSVDGEESAGCCRCCTIM